MWRHHLHEYVLYDCCMNICCIDVYTHMLFNLFLPVEYHVSMSMSYDLRNSECSTPKDLFHALFTLIFSFPEGLSIRPQHSLI